MHPLPLPCSRLLVAGVLVIGFVWPSFPAAAVVTGNNNTLFNTTTINPFQPKVLQGLYEPFDNDFACIADSVEFWRPNRLCIERWTQGPSLLTRLQGYGAHVTELGIDVTPIFAEDSPKHMSDMTPTLLASMGNHISAHALLSPWSCREKVDEHDIALVLGTVQARYFPHPMFLLTQQLFRQIGAPGFSVETSGSITRFLNSFSEQERTVLEDLRKSGVARITHWPGLPNSSYHPNVHHFHKNGKPSHRGWLAQFLAPNSFLRRIVHGYFRDPRVLLNRVSYLHLAAQDTARDVPNTMWHNDACGSRLKAYVWLHDVDADARPTRILAGTHRMQWFPPVLMFGKASRLPRLADSVVEDFSSNHGYPEVLMTGSKFGGFIFDTNAMHAAGNLKHGTKSRSAIVLDLSTERHMEVMDHIKSSDYAPRWSLKFCGLIPDVEGRQSWNLDM